MRIGLVVSGGVDRSERERVVPSLLDVIARIARRHELHVFVLDYYASPCTYPLRGATVHDLGRVVALPGTRRLRIERRLKAALAVHGPFDVLHAYWGMPAGVATTRVALGIGVPAVMTLDSGELVAIEDIDYGLQRRWFDRRAIARAIRRASAVTVATRYMARMPALRSAQPTVIPMGTDPARFAGSPTPDGPPWRLVRVGSINKVKDHVTLLHAVATLPGDVHLDVVGEDTLSGAAQSLAARLGLDARVTFHGFQPNDRLAAFYARAHLNVVSSRHESANVTMLEAACMGVPTVGSAVGYAADWHPDRAVAVRPRDPDALAGAIADLLRDPVRRRSIANAAQTWTLAHDADWTAAQFERLYADVVMRR